MQRNTVTVRLAGDLGNTVEKHGVSPAEIVILRTIHGGPDTVVNVRPRMMDKMPHREERARLEYIYSPAIVEQLFPGKFTPLPVTNKEIEVEEQDPEEFDVNESGEAAAAVPPHGPSLVPDDDLGMTEDELALVESIRGFKTKAELRDFAEHNKVDVSSVPDRVEPIRDHIIKSLFPDFTG